jgi:acyl-coenzyme A thioesterase PaaI-like protein
MVMKIFTFVFSLFMAAAMVILSPAQSHAGQVTAAEVADHMDKTKYSSDDIKSYLKALKGKQIVADGKVDDVKTGRTGAKVVVKVEVPGRSKDFVVDVRTKDAAVLHKGDRVSCKGEYTKYNMFTLNGIGIDGSCSK